MAYSVLKIKRMAYSVLKMLTMTKLNYSIIESRSYPHIYMDMDKSLKKIQKSFKFKIIAQR